MGRLFVRRRSKLHARDLALQVTICYAQYMNCPEPATEIPVRKIDPEAWKETLKSRQESLAKPWDADEREQLEAFNRNAGAGDLVVERIALLGDAQTLVVIGGQQAGLFLTPMLIVYKALAAIQWAEKASEALGRPVVPMFWLASEDHDFEEVRSVQYLGADGRVEGWRYEPDNEADVGRSVFDVAFEKQLIQDRLLTIKKATGAGDYKEEVFQFLDQAVEDSANLEQLFARLLMHLFGSSGLVLIPSRLPALRNRARVILQREIENAGRSTALLGEAIEVVRARGEKPALHRKGNEANFFLYRERYRCPVRCVEQGFEILQPGSGEVRERISQGDLLAELQSAPENFSPNVVTRPIIQDSALPVIGMIAGPSEEKYLELLRGCFSFFDVSPSRVLKRPRALLIEPRIERLLGKLSLDAEALAGEDWSAVEEAVLRDGKGMPIQDAVGGLGEQLERSFEGFSESLGELGQQQVIRESIDKTLRSNLRNLGKLEQRLVGELQRSQQAGRAQWDKLQAALCPGGLPQERVLWPFTPYLSSLGPRLIPWLQEVLDVEQSGLQVLSMRSAWEDNKTES